MRYAMITAALLLVLSAASFGQATRPATEPATQPALTLERQIAALDAAINSQANPPSPDERIKLATAKLQLQRQLSAKENRGGQRTGRLSANTPTVREPAAPTNWNEWEAQQAQLDPENRPYELKGDRLGMPLKMFKRKYYRKMPDDPRAAPFCSDQSPDIDIPTLLYKAEYAEAAIVYASTTFPYEENDTPPNGPTIAGVPADPFVYQFVDGRLYEITVFFHHDDFGQVMEALKAKFGEPKGKDTRTYQNAFGAKFDGDVVLWSNAVSEITVFERAGRLDESLLVMSHKELTKTADDHMKAKIKPRTDDL